MAVSADRPARLQPADGVANLELGEVSPIQPLEMKEARVWKAIIALAVWQLLLTVFVWRALDHRVNQEERVCRLIPGADCSFLKPDLWNTYRN